MAKEASMKRYRMSVIFCSALAVIVSAQMAHAENLARYQCNVVNFATQEPIGDRPDHTLSLLEYSCLAVDGALKGALYTGANTVEWDGPKGRIIVGGGIHRLPGGRAVTELSEGVASIVMKDGKFAGNEASGRGVIKYAGGAFAALNGKQVRFTSTPVSPIRFILDMTTE
jgi:hypothetical protein